MGKLKMGCGGSKKEILEGCEKPLCHKMEKIDIEEIDACFDQTSQNIVRLEEMRKLLVDELMDNMYHTGGIVYKMPCPKNAIESCIWRLAVDNKGKVSEIGYNSETMIFEGSCNSEKGNMIANTFCSYMKAIKEVDPENCKDIAEKIGENQAQINSNSDKFMEQVKEKFSSDKMKAMACCDAMKMNMAKATCAANCLKQCQERMGMIMGGMKDMMDCCSPDKFLEQQACVDKAMKSKQTENLPIAWNVVEAAERKKMTVKQMEQCYGQKLKARNEILAKMGAD